MYLYLLCGLVCIHTGMKTSMFSHDLLCMHCIPCLLCRCTISFLLHLPVLYNKSSNLSNHISCLSLPLDTNHRREPGAGVVDLYCHGNNNMTCNTVSEYCIKVKWSNVVDCNKLLTQAACIVFYSLILGRLDLFNLIYLIYNLSMKYGIGCTWITSCHSLIQC